jgi:hypothetical protein
MITVDGQNCPIQDWGATFVSCTLPPSGAGSEGDVIVTVNGIHSNAVSLTSWQGRFTYMITGEGTIQVTSGLILHWRTDIHKWRIAPHTTPQHYLFLANATLDSTAMWSASGGQTLTDPIGNVTTVAISGGGNLPWGTLSAIVAGQAFGAYFIVDPDARTLWAYPWAQALNQISVSGSFCTGPATFLTNVTDALQQVSIYQSPPPASSQQVPGVQALPIPMDANYTLQADQRSSTYGSGCPWGLTGATTLWMLSWPHITATHPPDPNAAQ